MKEKISATIDSDLVKFIKSEQKKRRAANFSHALSLILEDYKKTQEL